ncbi:LysR family transcriptional regulator [Fusibacter paucivorans]|uniref:LysR family transcriptional regulator n=1 Tax=Fusibacter paucivorans TaxID=76009 RepID=A0ABS5PMQ5_9FIRM|nr:LysR family transcriptional regulator [Fusibacter paucivorans]MBS7526464.1 LysR family transcriptional regulator [Fusibacter paucivorans]
MEFRNLKSFVHVAESGSFSKTAEQLGYAQSTITAQIDSLEKELGVSLFIRHGKRFSLSSEGCQLLAYAYQILKLEAEANAYFQGDAAPVGSLKVGMLESISASKHADVLSHFLSHYPDVKLEVVVATTLQLLSMLEKGTLDLIVTLDIPIRNPKFKCMLSKPVPIQFFADNHSPYAHHAAISLSDLARARFLLTEKGCNYRQVFEEILAEHALCINDSLEIGYTQIIIDCVREGLGISLLPSFNLTNALENGEIALVNVKNCSIELSLQILVLQNQWLSPAKKAFINAFTLSLS